VRECKPRVQTTERRKARAMTREGRVIGHTPIFASLVSCTRFHNAALIKPG
jgi:hypothetical protein